MGKSSCGRVETYAEDIARLRESAPDLAEQVVNFTGVGQVVDWMSRPGAGKVAIDMIAMDEFEYDVLVEAEAGGRWLAFGVT